MVPGSGETATPCLPSLAPRYMITCFWGWDDEILAVPMAYTLRPFGFDAGIITPIMLDVRDTTSYLGTVAKGPW